MTCEEYELLLSARLDGELTHQEEALLTAHLAQCPHCRQVAQQLAQLHEEMALLTADLPGRLKNQLADQDWSALSLAEDAGQKADAAAPEPVAEVPSIPNPNQAPSSPKKGGRPKFLWLACAAAAVLVAVMVWQLTLPNGSSSGFSQAVMEVFQKVSPGENQQAAKEDTQAAQESDQETQDQSRDTQTANDTVPDQEDPSTPSIDHPDTPGDTPGPEDPNQGDPGISDPGTDDPGTDEPDPPENILTQQQALDLLKDHLAQQGRSITLISLGSSGGMWRFSGKDASGQVVSFFMVNQTSGLIYEVPVPPKDEGPTIGYGPESG